MVKGKAKGPSWASERGRWIVPERGYIGSTASRARRVVKFGAKKTATRGRYADAQELKFHDVDVDDGSIAQGGTILNGGSINFIGQSVTESTRIGRKCTIKKIGWKYALTLASTATVAGQEAVRVILYLDKQANGATAAVADILETDDWQSFRNLANAGRFQLLMDRTHDLNPSGGAGNGTANDTVNAIHSFTFFKNVNIPLEFTGTANPSVLTEIRSNNLGVLVLAKNAGATGSIDSKFRLRFKDGR